MWLVGLGVLTLGVAVADVPHGGAASAADRALSVAEIEQQLSLPVAHTPFIPNSPLGVELSEFYVPKDNPLTRAKVDLGKQLYFDARLSRDNTVSCATCHHPTQGWTDQAPVSTGIEGQKGGRSAPTVMNRVFGTTQFWDGRAATLEAQAVGPIGNPIEMGFSVEEATARLNGVPGYALQFERIFSGPATPDRIGKAIATFERTVLVGGSPNDYYEAVTFNLDDDEGADIRAVYAAKPLSGAVLRGREVYFGKGRCDACHLGPNLSDEQFHNLGVGMDQAEPDLGRFVVTNKDADRGAFKTPTLRNIADTAPYMHDGSQATLAEVVAFYNRGGHKNPWLSGKIAPLGLTEGEERDLVTFLTEGLQGTVTPVQEPRLPE